MDGSPPGTLVLVRHGESTANADGTFTGSRDVDLSGRGIEQSHRAAAAIVAAGLQPDLIVTSRMQRARRTAEVMLPDLASAHRAPPAAVPVEETWRLNERDYGLLMGMPKTEVRSRFGPDVYFDWRRTRHGRPPPLPLEQRGALGLVPVDDDPEDRQSCALPGEGESLHDVVLRVRPLWQDRLRPALLAGRTVLVIGHGNSLRALCAVIDELDDDELEGLNLPTAQPIVYEMDPSGRVMPRGGRYLDPDTAWLEAVRIAIEGGT